jgi:hypothetical protein
MAPVDLKAYIRSTGAMADPKNLETAELLMTTGLTDSDKDRHLKSHLVSMNRSPPNRCVLTCSNSTKGIHRGAMWTRC